MYSSEACAAEVRLYIGVCKSPLISNIFALLDKIEMKLLCHLVYLLFIIVIIKCFAIAQQELCPVSATISLILA